MAMQIYLSQHSAPEAWGKNAIISVSNHGFAIHLGDNPLVTVQKAARKIKNQGILDVELSGEGWGIEQAWAFYQGYKSVKNVGKIQFPDFGKEQAEFDARMKTTTFVCDIINTPSDVVTPEILAHRAAEFITELANQFAPKDSVSYHIISREALKEQGYTGIWTVGKGSANLPAMLQLDFNPTGNPDAPVLACMVGKGITFDTGGYSLKPSASMSTMRSDMGGAALMTGSLGLAIARGLKKRVKLYLCCAENMVSSRAMKLGDIVHYRNGVKAEINNTDAEGRLVLADGLIDASKQHPEFIIDAATLTGAAKVAVGNDYHSVLTMDDALCDALFASAKLENELFWRLPFAEFHRNQIGTAFADISNTGSIPVVAGASAATAFLSHFVENYQQNWLHIDASSTFRKNSNELWSEGATGIGIKTVASLLLSK